MKKLVSGFCLLSMMNLFGGELSIKNDSGHYVKVTFNEICFTEHSRAPLAHYASWLAPDDEVFFEIPRTNYGIRIGAKYTDEVTQNTLDALGDEHDLEIEPKIISKEAVFIPDGVVLQTIKSADYLPVMVIKNDDKDKMPSIDFPRDEKSLSEAIAKEELKRKQEMVKAIPQLPSGETGQGAIAKIITEYGI